MNTSIRKIASLWLIFASASSFAQQTMDADHKHTMTLQEILAAVEKNPILQAYNEKINALNAFSHTATALEAPKITAGLWMTPYNILGNGKPAMANGNTGQDSQSGGALMLGVEQMIMNPAKRKAEQRYLQGMSAVELTMQSAQRQDLIEMAKSNYYELLVSKRKLKVLEESEELLTLMIKSAEINYAYNQGKLSSLYKANAELYKLQNRRLATENEISLLHVSLSTLMNIDKSTVFDIDTIFSLANYELMPLDTAAIAAGRSDVRNAEENVRLNMLRSKYESSKRKPDFGIQYAHMNGLGSMPNQFNLMAMLTIPIVPWAAKGYKANLKGIQAGQAFLKLRRESIVNEVAGTIQKLKMDIGSRKQQLEMYEKNILPTLQKNYQTSLIAFEHMKEDLFMTMDAWMTLKLARLEHLDLLAQVLKMQTEYERAIEK